MHSYAYNNKIALARNRIQHNLHPPQNFTVRTIRPEISINNANW